MYIIKTHGSVSCGPRSRRVTPVSILTGRKKTQFLHLRSSVFPWWNKTMFAVDMPSNFSTPHSKFEQNRFTRSRDIRLQKLAQFLRFFFFLFFFSCRTLTKTAIKRKCHIQFPWNLTHRRGYKGASWYQLWLEYDKQAKSYERLFTKSNTNMLLLLLLLLLLGYVITGNL